MLFVTLLLLLVLFGAELLYFRIAERYQIIDNPNHRSSHSMVTLRGGGIIFVIAALLYFLISGFQYPYFILGLVLISAVSFLDDIRPLPNKIRLAIHLIAVICIFYQWDIYNYLHWYWLIIMVLSIIGTLNAYNFMDGINGITGSYSLLTILTLYYVNESLTSFTSGDFLITIGLSLLVFNFFNFRNRAKCFSGDVGSLSIAFIIIFLIGQLIIKTQNFTYVLLLLCYGLDTITTIILRLSRRENIFEAHRSHFYQFLANEYKLGHLWVSVGYFVMQFSINLGLLFYVKDSLPLGIAFTFICLIVFVCVRFSLQGRNL